MEVVKCVLPAIRILERIRLEKERGLVGRRRKRKWFFSSSDCPLMFPLNVMNEELKKDTECMSVYFPFFKTAIRSYYGTM